MSLLSSEELKNASFINMFKVVATLKNHKSLGKDIQNLYNNLPTSMNSVLITTTVKKWNGILECSNQGIVLYVPDSSCEIDGHHRICRGSKLDGRVFTYWINTTWFPIYKWRDKGDSDGESPGRYHPYARSQTLSRRSTGSSYTEAVAVSEAEAKRDGFTDSKDEMDAAVTDVDQDGEYVVVRLGRQAPKGKLLRGWKQTRIERWLAGPKGMTSRKPQRSARLSRKKQQQGLPTMSAASDCSTIVSEAPDAQWESFDSCIWTPSVSSSPTIISPTTISAQTISPTLILAPTISTPTPMALTWSQDQLPQSLEFNPVPMDFNMLPMVPNQPATPLSMMAANPYGLGEYGIMGMGMGNMGGGWMLGNGFNGLLPQLQLIVTQCIIHGRWYFYG
ncbi:hypothetical protein BDK51DRAFT_32696 [Blyttiomyces helicus]|uniref:Uncharacterized protein n=1 Tax=Blyttiomyces helicus TaxID=388810 RepID=A0A4P9WP70_9FUNG|nr:hypothetical protein BDK51DRAFT_32696 [Blyttiomyces helicus]|eukprot:RKO94814.1 hypothetical protein BDK51DRAFT_32696 [Blyttiomyces helicus]